MCPVYEYVCSNKDCPEKKIERLCKYDERDIQECDDCKSLLINEVSAVHGRVAGGTRRFHRRTNTKT